jgi:hypothetical protein
MRSERHYQARCLVNGRNCQLYAAETRDSEGTDSEMLLSRRNARSSIGAGNTAWFVVAMLACQSGPRG